MGGGECVFVCGEEVCEGEGVSDQEEWRPVVGWEDCYEVSNLGNVRSVPRKWGKFIRGAARKPALSRLGYYRLSLKRYGRLSCRTVHSLVAEAFIGPVPPGSCVNHLDGIKSNNKLSNLEICTNSENHIHRSRVLGIGQGDTHGAAVITESDVVQIRADYAEYAKTGRIKRRFAEEASLKYGIGISGICAVVYGRSWRHVREHLPLPSASP